MTDTEMVPIRTFEEATISLAYLSIVVGMALDCLVKKGVITEEEVNDIVGNATNLMVVKEDHGSC